VAARLTERRAPVVIACLVAASVAASAVPGAAEILEFDRSGLTRTPLWRAATAQLVHWSVGMAAIDLAVVAIAGACLELRSRRIACWTLAFAIVLVGVTVLYAIPSLERYRGSSGIAAAVVAALLVDVVRRERSPVRRVLAAGIGVAFVAKFAWELATGSAIPIGHLPPGIAVAPQVHVAGAIAGIAASLGFVRSFRAYRSRPSSGRS
jgi:rhomboid family GlyGly-CTERM serine protease